MCGKNSKTLLSLQASAGSPPRVREKPRAQLRTLRYAQDHPRVCGKNQKNLIYSPIIQGSPPRVREKLVLFPCLRRGCGITPACAGKTIEDIPNRFSMGDHPRVCGKNVNHCYRDSVFSGSPPRVREKLTPIVSTVVATRITPACAGKTD